MPRRFEHVKSFGLVAISGALIFALLLGSVVPAKAAGDRVVKIGWHGIWTGPIAATGGPAGDGIMEYVEELNKRGGIDGIKLEVIWYETRATVPGMIIAHKRFKEAGVVAEFSILETGVEAMLPLIARDGFPHILATAHSTRVVTKPVPWVFTAEPSAGDSGAVMVKWFRDNWTEERRPKVGAILYDSASCWEWLGGVKWACEQWDMEFIGREVVPFAGAVDTSVEWLRLVGKKADAICVATCGATQVVTIKDAFRLEVPQKGIKLLELGYCIMDNMDICGAEAEGWYFPLFAPCTWEQAEEYPSLKIAYESAQKFHGLKKGEALSTAYFAGRSYYVPIIVEAIRLAIQKVGFENLTGPAVREGMVSIRDLDIGCGPPITVTDVKPWFADGVYIYEIRQGMPHCIDWREYPGYYKTLHFYE